MDWAFVSPVSLVSLILKLIDRIKEREVGKADRGREGIQEQKVGNHPLR
jgi:hypothetical protein